MNDRTSSAYAAAIGGGAILWLATTAITGNHEAWDASAYWSVTYPLAILLAGGLGYYAPAKPWRWGLAVMLAQAMVLIVTGSDYSLLPLGLFLFAVLALPAIYVARMAARFRLRGENVR